VRIVEPSTRGPAGSRSREWILPVIVLIAALAIVAALVILTFTLLGRSATSSASPSASVSATEVSPPTATSPGQSEAASSAPAAPSGEETSVFELEVGDCFSVDSDQLETVTVVDCEASHEYEVFALIDHEAGADEPYPGDSEVLAYADTVCQPPFEAYVGHDYETSIWYITSLSPSEETWADGDREIVCTLNQQDDSQEPIAVTGTAEGSAQ
jgi:hypothetical protein